MARDMLHALAMTCRKILYRSGALSLVASSAIVGLGCVSTAQAERRSPEQPQTPMQSTAGSPGPASVTKAQNTPTGEPSRSTTASFRGEHAEIKEHLEHLRQRVGALHTGKSANPQEDMKFVADFLREHIASHAEWEERALYPIVDRQAGCTGEHPFTESMRYEHGIVGRWIRELETAAASPQADASAFARRADGLLALISAHFEKEEEVFLPIIDATMTAKEFEAELEQ